MPGLGRGRWAVSQKDSLIQFVSPHRFELPFVHFDINLLITIAISDPDNTLVLTFFFFTFFVKVLLKETGSQGVIASIVSWVTSSTNAPPVLWEIKVG